MIQKEICNRIELRWEPARKRHLPGRTEGHMAKKESSKDGKEANKKRNGGGGE